jgi:beta-glucosidase
VLELVERCNPGVKTSSCDYEANAWLSCEIAKDSAVLLKNDGSLPLSGDENILVVGEMFEKMRYQGAGSSLINPSKLIAPKTAFDRRGIRYSYERGYRLSYSGRDAAMENSALAAAAQAGTILFFGGLTDFEESEGFDREHMRLGDSQAMLLEALIATGKKVVLVLFAGAPVELPSFDGIAAVLDMYLPGMYGGEAAAALLFGETNPSGRLAESWPLRAEDSSSSADYGQNHISKYYESIYIGYRHYDKAGSALRFPFGHGLSYTSFNYGDPEMDDDGSRITVRIPITNAGKMDGAEVVQLYVENAESPVFKASKELRAFTKLFLKRGETRTAVLSFNKSDLAYWNTELHAWVLENGIYAICLGASVADIRVRSEFPIKCGMDVSSPYSPNISSAYSMPPKDVPSCFSELVGMSIPAPRKAFPVTVESPLRDLRASITGRILYSAVMGVVRKDYKKALKMPDSLERDSMLKNSYFVVRMMPANSIRSMCMSSSGHFSYNSALGFVELANGHLLKGIKLLMKRENRMPLPREEGKDKR